MAPRRTFGPVIVHSSDSIHYANDACLDLFATDSRSAVVGASVTDFVAPQYRDALSTQFDRIIDEEVPTLGLSVELERPDSNERSVIDVSSPIDWDGAALIHTSFLGVAVDGHTTGVALRDHAMNAAPVGITVADATAEDEPLVYVNDRFVELTG